MKNKIEINLLPETEASARSFVDSLDKQIAELEENLHLLKTARGAVARTFGIDRRDGTFVQKLVDGARRSETEISESDLERELSIGVVGIAPAARTRT